MILTGVKRHFYPLERDTMNKTTMKVISNTKLTASQVADKTGLSLKKVYAERRNLGITDRIKSAQRDAAVKKWISFIKAWNNGATLTDIGNSFGVSTLTAKGYVKILRRAYPKLVNARGKTTRKVAVSKLNAVAQRQIKSVKSLKLDKHFT